MEVAPFIVYALPRSRTAWLSRFLSYRAWTCYHDQTIYMRETKEIKQFFDRPNTGAAETAASYGRHLIRHSAPGIREVVILRPVEEVIDSLLKVDIDGIALFDLALLKRNMEYGDRELRKIAKDKNVLTIEFNDLKKRDACAAIFKHCLPYEFDHDWWNFFMEQNIQVDIKAILQYCFEHRKEIDRFKSLCKSELFKLGRAGEIRNRSV